jgi:hypothetical protein
MDNRFLFVLETSSSMASRTNGIENAIVGLLKTGIHGELRPGDTIGFWTYSDRLRPDFPMQVWSHHSNDAIVENIGSYLRHLRYEKRGHLEKVLPQILQIIGISERVTIIFLSDGNGQVGGTPFDRDINELQKKYAREFRDAHEPIITILAARDGQPFDYTINYPNTISVPHTADPWPPPVTNAPVVATASAPAPAPPPPHRHIEIIMSGRTNVAPSPLPAPVAVAAPVSTPAPLPPTPSIVTAPPVANISTAPAPASAPLPSPVAAAPLPAPAATASAPVGPAGVPVAVPTFSPAPQTVASAPNLPVLTPAPNPMPPPLAAASAGQQVALFVIAFSLLTIAVVLVIFLVRRSRGDPPPSLISQSIDRSR